MPQEDREGHRYLALQGQYMPFLSTCILVLATLHSSRGLTLQRNS